MIKYPAVKSMQKQINMTVGAAVMGFMEAALADAAAWFQANGYVKAGMPA